MQELLQNAVKSAGQAACISNEMCHNADCEEGTENVRRTRSSPKSSKDAANNISQLTLTRKTNSQL